MKPVTLLIVGAGNRGSTYAQYAADFPLKAKVVGVAEPRNLEPVGFFHQAHSFVRGNWGSSKKSSPMLLAKSCHDLDWIRYFMDSPCTHISSFGSLFHFRPENKPNGASERCLDCSVAPDCPYDAQKIYLSRAQKGESGWPLNTITSDLSLAGVTTALRDGPYGRCVYAGQNDVVDHQVVNMQFADSRSASFTMTGFTEMAPRQTRIFGTHGQISGDGRRIEIYDFLQEKKEIIDTAAGDDGSIRSGHGGGDYGLMDAFVAAVAQNDSSLIRSGARESLESHMMVFAAEKARLENRVVSLSEYGF